MKAVISACLLAISAGLLSGCGVLYDIGQDKAIDQCNKMTDFVERQACLKRSKMSLEEYDKQREKQIEADRKANAK